MPRTKYNTEEERIEARRAASRKYRQNNKEKCSAMEKDYRNRNKEKYAEYQREWRRKNPGRAKELDSLNYRNNRDKNHKSRMLQAAKGRAKELDLPFNLAVEDIEIPEFCPVLGIKLKRGNHNSRPELDRIVPKLGYVKGNVCVISGRANRIKWNASLEELEAVANYVRRGS